MKHKVVLALMLLLVVFAACKKEETTSNDTAATGTLATTDPSATGMKVDTAMTAEIASIATHDLQRALRSLPPSVIQVDFVGLVCHVTPSGGVQRAVLPKVAGHNHALSLSPADPAALRTLLGSRVSCPSSVCVITINGDAFRVVDASGGPLTGTFTKTANFTNFVTSLQSIPPPGSARFANLKPEVFGAGPSSSSSDVAGWFELAGGAGDAAKFTCPARFDGDPGPRDFARTVWVTYRPAGGGKLQILRRGQTTWDTIDLANGFIQVDNNTTVAGNHFVMYAKLSASSAAATNFPNLTKEDPNQSCGVNGGPGCSNSAWP